MSGIEIVGVVAAAAQLIDLGVKVALKLNNLTSSLQRVPERLSSTSVLLAAFVGVCQDLSTNLEATSNLSIPAETTDRIHSIFDACTKEATALEAVLDNISIAASTNAWTKSWKKIVGLQKEKEIVERCERLECHKTMLALICHQRQLHQSQEQGTILSDIKAEVGLNTSTIADLRNVVESSLNSLLKDLRGFQQIREDTAISPGVASTPSSAVAATGVENDRTTYQSWMKVDQMLSSMSSDLQQLLWTQKKQEGMECENEQAVLTQSLSNTEKLITQSQRLTGAIRSAQPPDCSETSCVGSSSQMVLTWYHQRSYHCQFLVGPFWIYYEQRKTHQKTQFCRKIYENAQSATFGVFVRRFCLAFETRLAVVSGSRTHSIGPSVSIARVVHRSRSPAFKLFNSLHSDFAELHPVDDAHMHNPTHPCGYHHFLVNPRENKYCHLQWDMPSLSRCLELLKDQLESLFRSGRASPLDVDCDGRTLLHEVAILASLISFPSVQVSQAIQSLITFLIQHNLDPNARCRRVTHTLLQQDPFRESLTNVDAMDIAIRGMVSLEDHPDDDWVSRARVRTDAMLSSHGCKLTNLSVNNDGIFQIDRVMPVVALSILRCIEGSSEVIGYGPVGQAVIHRQLSVLKGLLASGHDAHELPAAVSGAEAWYHRPLTLALHWPEGFKALLTAGVDPVDTATYAIDAGYETAIGVLLEHDLPLSSAYLGDRTILEALLGGQLDMLLQERAISLAANQRLRLQQLALAVLPYKVSTELTIDLRCQSTVIDAGSFDVQCALEQYGVTVPMPIKTFSSKSTTIYHSPNVYDTVILQRLFDTGFREVDIIDEASKQFPTPLMRHCIEGNQEQAIWFLEHGARTRVEHKGFVWLAQNMLAASVGDRNGAQEKDWLKPLAVHFNFLACDNCSCWCSSRGCNSITMLQKVLSNGCAWCSTWDEKLVIVSDWINAANMTIGRQLEAWVQFYRSEIFTRLGMAHTCCQIERELGVELMDQEEQTELRSEDKAAGLLDELDSLMLKYLTITSRLMRNWSSGSTLESLCRDILVHWQFLNEDLPNNVTREERMGDPSSICSRNHKHYNQYITPLRQNDLSLNDTIDDLHSQLRKLDIGQPNTPELEPDQVDVVSEPSIIEGVRRMAKVLVVAPFDLMERTRPMQSGLGPP